MTDIPLPQSTNDIFDYGFDKSLNRNSESPSTEASVEKTVQDVLANSGIDLNTTTSSPGISGNFERNDFHWICLFDSKDAIAVVGTVTLGVGPVSLLLETAAVLNDYSEALRQISGFSPFNDLSWDKNKKLRCSISGSSLTAQELYVSWGGTGTSKGMGLKVINNILYGFVGDGTTESTVVCATLGAGWTKRCTIKYYAGLRVDYYVDDVLTGSISTGLPSGTAGAHNLFYAKAKTTEGVSKNLTIYGWEIWQSS